MASLNLCQFIGNVGKIETRYMSNGEAVTNFSIACNDSYKNKNGEKVDKTEWVSCVSYRKLAQIIVDYCTKGMQIYVSGKMETRKYTDKNGIERYTTQIIVNEMQMLGGKKDSAESNGSGGSKSSAGSFDDIDSDIPF